jgi:hypothetical protein
MGPPANQRKVGQEIYPLRGRRHCRLAQLEHEMNKFYKPYKRAESDR